MLDGRELRDNISIAFHKSEYATPYGDNTIPGNHPGYRHKRLGRQYAPDPVNRDSLRVDFYAPGNGVRLVNALAPSDFNSMQNLLLARDARNNNYVLDSVRGGRRHFCETRGAEERHLRMRRALNSPTSGRAELVPSCRAPGMYNYERGGPLVQAMLQNRERQKMLQEAGKAMVAGPPNHNPLYLGFMFSLPSIQATNSQVEPLAVETTDQVGPTDTCDSATAVAKAEETTKLPSPTPGLPLEHSPPAYLTGIAPQRQRQAYMSTRRGWSPMQLITNDSKPYRKKRKVMESEASRLEDIRLVELLPKIKTEAKK
ncbi:uncharacterized protein TEOVI_000779700 [Trypanosoma equiperdum]|uniref:Uncharacterized protein n=4 Tax=Trypanozoon TaxID=39700 RepID=Q386B5_TRYB2|nr:hypothetical protein, conserved [Trypanosoma brucei gambiense DAL972]XP_828478.1 hypothetical protein, conserved [Trypanosoma brucei brucei TREU927]RHW67748.1 hypothetical protein DPX39_110047800 [Trypanosoma brucei equiperdum]SCU66619.1 hypothetical protein, conserved [Trypanosoma equiperdum]EAN79366.1 hypothetical protein, conserved [Trypanosoma brucei brucei TREU927]CBH17343.1 hypothetical protein, conserved [Trypanosoma brucei gambiense DAL972]|eukprot:XP_011779607.1 hypothetical protein, conserved [Trypanosoma brucei gambiense DAL972]